MSAFCAHLTGPLVCLWALARRGKQVGQEDRCQNLCARYYRRMFFCSRLAFRRKRVEEKCEVHRETAAPLDLFVASSPLSLTKILRLAKCFAFGPTDPLPDQLVPTPTSGLAPLAENQEPRSSQGCSCDSKGHFGARPEVQSQLAYPHLSGWTSALCRFCCCSRLAFVHVDS